MKITDAQVGQMREEARAGATVKALARKYGISSASVSTMIHGQARANAPGPIAPPHRHYAKDAHLLTDHQIVLARLRAAAGQTNTDLATEYGVSDKTMSDYVRGKIGRQLPGPRTNKRAKLKPADVEYIRETYAAGIYNAQELADIFEVGRTNINKITSGYSWKTTPGPITTKPPHEEQA